jgi:hypothetical protein
MFDEELTEVEESFRGLGRARTGVRERGSRADEQALTDALHATERVRRAADALELTVLGQAVRFEDQWGADGVYRQVQLPAGQVGEFAPEAAAVVTRAGIFEAGERCDLAARAVTDLACLTDLLAEGRIRARAMGVVAKETREASEEAVAAVLEHLLAPLRGKPGTTRIEDLEERELRKATRRVLERVEPELLQERAARNRREAVDVRFSEGLVGTADMRATLPTEDALVLKEAIEQAAAARRALDPSLTAAASRAHGLLDLALRGVEVRALVRLGIPVVTSAASRLTFAPFEGGEGQPGGRRRHHRDTQPHQGPDLDTPQRQVEQAVRPGGGSGQGRVERAAGGGCLLDRLLEHERVLRRQRRAHVGRAHQTFAEAHVHRFAPVAGRSLLQQLRLDPLQDPTGRLAQLPLLQVLDAGGAGLAAKGGQQVLENRSHSFLAGLAGLLGHHAHRPGADAPLRQQIGQARQVGDGPRREVTPLARLEDPRARHDRRGLRGELPHLARRQLDLAVDPVRTPLVLEPHRLTEHRQLERVRRASHALRRVQRIGQRLLVGPAPTLAHPRPRPAQSPEGLLDLGQLFIEHAS